MLNGQETHVPDATRVVVDKRAKHYWDGSGLLISGYQQVLSLPVPAWDIYMVYGPEAQWDDSAPPSPVFWMHQLGSSVEGPRLDAVMFGERVMALLDNQKGTQSKADDVPRLVYLKE
jgi:hypothetical protein